MNPSAKPPIQCTKTVMHGMIPHDLSKWSMCCYVSQVSILGLLSQSDLGFVENHTPHDILDSTAQRKKKRQREGIGGHKRCFKWHLCYLLFAFYIDKGIYKIYIWRDPFFESYGEFVF